MGRLVLDSLVVFLRKAAPNVEGDDGRLLARCCAGDDLAFSALVHRYAPLVWGVCRRTLIRQTDAEDAFQATFVVLFRKAKSLSGSGPIGPFLHAVACKVTAKARERSHRQASREVPLTVEPMVESALPDDLREVLDEEIARLPEKYRAPIVLCYLEGLTNEAAAEHLGCPKGTILSRLSRARDRLRERLSKRGLDLPGVISALPVPTSLAEAVAQAAPLIRDAALSPSVLTLAEGVALSMFLNKMKIVALALIALVVVSGAGLWASRPTGGARAVVKLAEQGKQVRTPPGEKKPAPKDEKKQDEKKQEEAPRTAIELHKALAKTVEFPGIDDPRTTLVEALDQVAKIHGVSFVVNQKAFEAEGLATGRENGAFVEKLEIIKERPIYPRKTALRTVLRQILQRIPSEPGATYLIRKDHIEITTTAAVYLELELPLPKEDLLLIPLPPLPPLPPLVHEEFDKVPLSNALRRLAEDAEVNVLLDVRVEKKANVEVTATCRNMPIQTALELLADQAELAVVKRGNAFYVTSPENAEKLNRAKKK